MSTDTGYAPTPPRVADFMTTSVFGIDRPTSEDTVFYPGLGTGHLYDAVHRYCTPGDGYVSKFDYDPPQGVAYEIDPELVTEFRQTHPDAAIKIYQADFLTATIDERVDYVLANPPYIHYNDLPDDRRNQYTDRFDTAHGQYNSYYLFFEQALRALTHGGTLTFLTPIQYLFADNAQPLRRLLSRHTFDAFYLMPDAIFDETTQTMITTLRKVEHPPPNFAWSPPSESDFWLKPLYRYEHDYFFPDRTDDEKTALWAEYRDLARNLRGPVRRATTRRSKTRQSPPEQVEFIEYYFGSTVSTATSIQAELSKFG
ncbi:Eco57I restriction-modification methylase domain-containing protein [Halobellus rufus]|jgi:SAM-dependent methyltransferase|uniref:Eco57I restriction-modification methylase domain-containing protein n=1 Tax=Halobellus rufus TaxID=1448860 RepID=UPI000678A909|nr:N-6 DNA methylase [Halobellus rufus]